MMPAWQLKQQEHLQRELPLQQAQEDDDAFETYLSKRTQNPLRATLFLAKYVSTFQTNALFRPSTVHKPSIVRPSRGRSIDGDEPQFQSFRGCFAAT